jgi:O-acetyl-ADP-ribose deacetylase (regulator of RNase III)
MKQACAVLAPLEMGCAVATPGFNLPDRSVFHALVPHDLADREAEEQRRRAANAILKLAAETHVQSLSMPPIGTGRIKSENEVAAAIIIKALNVDAPSLAPELRRLTICLPALSLAHGFDKAQQLNDPNDQRPKVVN